VIVCAVQCGSSRHHGLPAIRHAQKQKQKPPPPPADTRGAVNQLTHRNKNKNEAKETPI